MTKTYLLIDLQNRKPAPECVASWMGTDGEAWIFFGEQEIKLLPQYMELGERVSIVDISKPGKNSLDFHLVLYLGYLAGRHEPNARFVIVAEDGDYDPAIVHARSKGRKVERVESLSALPAAAKIGKSRSVSLVYDGIRKHLREAGRPKNPEALKKLIQSRFGPEPLPDKVDAVMTMLQSMDVINVVDGALIYLQAQSSPEKR